MNARTRKLLAKLVVVLAIGGLAPVVSGCSGCQDDEVNPELLSGLSDDKGIKIGMKLSDAERDDAARLLASVNNARFPDRMVRRDENAKLFVYIAAKSNKPNVIRAALRAMSKTHTGGSASKGRRAVDADYGTVVAAHLASKDNSVVSAALSAAGAAVTSRQPDPHVLDALLRVATSHPVDGGRISAINVLIKIPHYRRNPRIAAGLLKLLNDKSPAVLSHLLYQVYQPGVEELQQKPAFEAAARKLMQHADPAVRGRAARFIAELAPRNVEIRGQVRAMLDDKHPYPRSIAAHALGAMHDVAAIHLLVPKLKDMTRNNYHLSYKKLSGKEYGVPHGARNETVADTCAVNIEALSAKLPKPWKRVSRKHEQADRNQNLASANAWYAKNKAEIPPLDAPPAAADSAAGKAKPDANREAQDAKSGAGPGAAKAKAASKPLANSAPAPAGSAK